MKARAVIFFILLFALCSFAQTAFSGLQITVQDTEGAVIPGAKITVVHAERRFKQACQTNLAGECRLPNLPPGSYKITVKKRGFHVVTVPASIPSLDAGLVSIDIKLLTSR